MTDFDEALVGYLLSLEALTALVGDRVYPDYFPQEEQLPAVAYSLESDRSLRTQQGASALREAVYQINVWAETRKQAMTAAGAIREALDGYRGAFGDVPVAGAFLDGLDRARDPETGAYLISMRFTIHYRNREA